MRFSLPPQNFKSTTPDHIFSRMELYVSSRAGQWKGFLFSLRRKSGHIRCHWFIFNSQNLILKLQHLFVLGHHPKQQCFPWQPFLALSFFLSLCVIKLLRNANSVLVFTLGSQISLFRICNSELWSIRWLCCYLSFLQEYPDSRRILNRSFDSCVGQAALLSQSESPVQPHMVMNNIFERSVGEWASLCSLSCDSWSRERLDTVWNFYSD